MNILFEDNHLLVAVKPHMMPTAPDASGDPDFLSQAKDYIAKKYNKPGEAYLGLVQRLDRPAGGVMVFARTSKAAARLSKQLINGEIHKTYLAVLTGAPAPFGELTDFLVKDQKTNTVRVAREGEPGAKRAALAYELLGEKNGLSLAAIRLYTGRSHQIRVQFSSRGFPLFGDARYGKGEGEHLALFSTRLSLLHPTKGLRMSFSTRPSGEPFLRFSEELDAFFSHVEEPVEPFLKGE